MKIHNIERKEGSNNRKELVIASLIVLAVVVALFIEPTRQLLGQ